MKWLGMRSNPGALFFGVVRRTASISTMLGSRCQLQSSRGLSGTSAVSWMNVSVATRAPASCSPKYCSHTRSFVCSIAGFLPFGRVQQAGERPSHRLLILGAKTSLFGSLQDCRNRLGPIGRKASQKGVLGLGDELAHADGGKLHRASDQVVEDGVSLPQHSNIRRFHILPTLEGVTA